MIQRNVSSKRNNITHSHEFHETAGSGTIGLWDTSHDPSPLQKCHQNPLITFSVTGHKPPGHNPLGQTPLFRRGRTEPPQGYVRGVMSAIQLFQVSC